MDGYPAQVLLSQSEVETFDWNSAQPNRLNFWIKGLSFFFQGCIENSIYKKKGCLDLTTMQTKQKFRPENYC